MHQIKSCKDVNFDEFLESGLWLKPHLASYLNLTVEQLEDLLPKASDKLAALHPGCITPEETTSFYEEEVGTAHLIELAAWHLSSADYIVDTLKLQKMFAHGQVLDFGGGIGTHALMAAANAQVDHVHFVDLNPQNREFVSQRAYSLGLNKKISVYRDLESTGNIEFDTIVCLDVLEHLPDPSSQIVDFKNRLSSEATLLLNWYFFYLITTRVYRNYCIGSGL